MLLKLWQSEILTALTDLIVRQYFTVTMILILMSYGVIVEDHLFLEKTQDQNLKSNLCCQITLMLISCGKYMLLSCINKLGIDSCFSCCSEKAKLQAEARAAEEARRKAEAKAAADVKKARGSRERTCAYGSSADGEDCWHQ